MGFWNELKQLGKEIGGELSNLGGELKEIGKDTVAEIKQDPTKFLAESIKEVAAGAAKVGKYILDEGIPDAAFKSTQEVERLYISGQLPSDRHAAHLETRKNGVTQWKRQLDNLIDKPNYNALNSEDLSKHINLLEKSYSRLDWFLKLPKLELDNDDLDEAKASLVKAKEKIRELESLQCAIKDNKNEDPDKS